MPQIAAILKEAIGKDISRTLNAEEVVAKGCLVTQSELCMNKLLLR